MATTVASPTPMKSHRQRGAGPWGRAALYGALADMGFDLCQLGQTDLALEQDTEALASILARHGRDHG